MQRLTVGVIAALVPVVMLTGCERAKIKLDREVDRLCAIDGGVHIYEKVTLPKEDFGPHGEVFPQHRSLPSESGRYGPLYFASIDRQTLVAGDPSLVKSTIRFIRRADGKLLGEQINYVRGGGDLPGPWNPSTHQCNQVVYSAIPLRNIFVNGN